MTSLWLDRAPEIDSDPWPESEPEVLVVGAGLAGLATAVLLATAGRRVAVVEARSVGAVTTGRSTAKVSLLQGTKLSTVLAQQPRERARAYVEASREAQAWVLDTCERGGVAFQRREAVTYAADVRQLGPVQAEHEAAASLGLDVRWSDRLDVPWPHAGATRLADQAQVDPVQLLAALAGELRAAGGTLHQGQRVVSTSTADGLRVRLEDGRLLRPGHLVLATGIPVLDRGLHFARVEPKRSYVVAYEGVDVPSGMYLSAGSSSRSVRDAPAPDLGTAMLVGGAGHTVGRGGPTTRHLDELRAWTSRYFPHALETHSWSAQDYSPVDALPSVGVLPGSDGLVHVATGFDKWGMTTAVVAALAISGDLLGHEPAWSRPLLQRGTASRDAVRALSLNARVGLAATVSAAQALAPVREAPPEGAGRVGQGPDGATATSTVDGTTCTLRAVCTHLGGLVRWNDAERSWDCPLHGSRFAPDGTVLEGPATRPLRRPGA